MSEPIVAGWPEISLSVNFKPSPSLAEKLAKRKTDGACVCCGSEYLDRTLPCGCGFCCLCVSRGHDSHDASHFHVPCVGGPT